MRGSIRTDTISRKSGTDYVYPRTTNKILRAMLLAKKVPAANIEEEYTPFHHQERGLWW